MMHGGMNIFLMKFKDMIQRNNGVLIKLFTLILCGLIVLVAFFSVRNWEQEHLQTQLEKSASAYQALFSARVNGHIAELFALKRFYEGSKFVDREEFKNFITPIFEHRPELHAFQWIPAVSHEQRQILESESFNKGLGGRRIYENSEQEASNKISVEQHDYYYPVIYVEPLNLHHKIVGYDLRTDEYYRTLIEQARDSRQVVISADLGLDNHGHEVSYSMGIVVQAIYQTGVDLSSIDLRREHFKGVVLLEFAIGMALEEAIKGLDASGLHVNIIDPSMPLQEQLLYAHHSLTDLDHDDDAEYGFGFTDALSYKIPMIFQGNEWLLEYKPESNFYKLHYQWRAWIVLITGLLLTVSFFAYVRSIIKRSVTIQSLVDMRTAELEASEIHQRAILETIADAIVTVDDGGRIVSFNPAAEKDFGYTVDEIVGENVSILLSENEDMVEQGNTDNTSLNALGIINQTRELYGCRKDSSIFPLELTVTAMEFSSERGFVAVLRDITERQRVDKMKTEFISTVSHELRTPLTSIRGSLGLICGGAVGELSEKAGMLLNIASNNTERLLLLINDILDIQKIESGRMSFKFQNLELMPFIEQALQDNAAYGEQYKVKFVIVKELDDALVYADKDRLMQVMANLLSNAAKFSPEGAEVEVSVTQQYDDVLRISITDHGAGVPEEFQSKLFDKFTQSDASDTRQIGGTGLGLSISKIIVEKHGGSIDFDSHEGVGTTFYMDLPKLIMVRNDHVTPACKNNAPCVLVVEDDRDVAALMERMLADAGYNSVIANDATEAREILQQNPKGYNAITLDLLLPGEDGISLLDDLRQDAATHDIPVVVVSVEADEAKRDLSGGAVGVIDWLSKPIDQDRLINAVKQAAEHGQLPRVLHVEDEVDVHKVVNVMLHDHCDLTWTDTFADSKEKLEREEFDLVLLDVDLPDGSGLDLLSVIERCEKQPRVVIFSAYDVDDEYADKVSAVLVKSKTDNARLTEVICDAINRSGFEKEA